MSFLFRRNSTFIYTISATVNYWKSGIGVSRRQIETQTRKQSPYIHSWSTLHRYVGCLNDFKKFCVANGIKRLNRITPSTLESFYKHKTSSGRWLSGGISGGPKRLLSEKTMKIHLAAQTKFFNLIRRQDLVSYINDHRGEILKPCRSFSKTQALSHPEAVILGINSHPHQVMAELQYFSGARVGDLKKMSLSGSRLFISKSKGGLSRVNDFYARPQELARIKELLPILKGYLKSPDWGWQRMLKTYSVAYRKGCRKAGEPQVSPHAFRASYVHLRIAQLENAAGGEKRKTSITDRTFSTSQKVERYIDKNIAKGYTSQRFFGTLVVTYYSPAGAEKTTEYNLAHYQVSQEIGHQRTEITRYYQDG